MGVYLTGWQIPEMARLSVGQRRFVKERCLFWLFRRFPYRAGSIAIMAGCILMAVYAAGTLKWGLWQSAALGGASSLVLDYIHHMIWLTHWRREVARFIELHAAEIQTAA